MKDRLRKFWGGLSVRHKLVLIPFIATTVSVLLGFSFVIMGTVMEFGAQERHRLSHVARIVADFSIAPLTFGDRSGALDRLAYLDTVPGVLAAAVLDKDNEVFVAWRKGEEGGRVGTLWQASDMSAATLADSDDVLVEEVESDGRYHGRITLWVSHGRLQAQIRRYVLAMTAIVVAVLLSAFLLSVRLQRTISAPILQLAKVVRSVAVRGDYSVRVSRDETDELGGLYMNFNGMLKQMQEREQERDLAQSELQKARTELEQRVEERTQDLMYANMLLNNEIDERERAEHRISMALREKEVLLREVHHRVKNNLQVIYGLLALQAYETNDAKLKSALAVSRQRVRMMALVHETLYRSQDLSEIDAEEFISNIVKELVDLYQTEGKRIQLSTEVDHVVLTLDLAVPVGLLINELVTNSLKYAFPGDRSGSVAVKMKRMRGNHGRLRLVVSDDGVGLPQGLDWRSTGTLGMQLIVSLAEQIGGHIDVKSVVGTSVSIVFPDPWA